LKADVFTLFPHWFDWFRTQRHVENALGLGHQVDAVAAAPGWSCAST
jgi:tRNA (guanine37-N1)-methyltransferase